MNFFLWPKLVLQDMTRRDEMSELKDMWRCQVANCDYVYDPEQGDRKAKIPAGTRFEDLPDTWVCPICGATKKSFRRLTDVDPLPGNV